MPKADGEPPQTPTSSYQAERRLGEKRLLADIGQPPQDSRVNGYFIGLMRLSLWLLVVAATAVGSFWLLLVVGSGFSIWNDSNLAGRVIQCLLVFYPVVLALSLSKTKNSVAGTIATFGIGWAVAGCALACFGLP